MFHLLIAILISAAGCTGARFTSSDISQLRKGMSISETRIITKTTPIYTLSFTGVNAPDTYEIQVYKLDSGGYLANYMLAYRNDELLYWGYPYEFARDKDPLLNEMGEKVIQQIMQYKAAQKQINQFP